MKSLLEKLKDTLEENPWSYLGDRTQDKLDLERAKDLQDLKELNESNSTT